MLPWRLAAKLAHASILIPFGFHPTAHSAPPTAMRRILEGPSSPKPTADLWRYVWRYSTSTPCRSATSKMWSRSR